MTRHHSCRVSPFGHPRIHARLTAPRGISQPPTSFIGSQCQGIHHAPLNTYNDNFSHKKLLYKPIFGKIAHPHTNTPPPERGRTSCCARCSQPLSTNQTPHPTTKRGDNTPSHPQAEKNGLVASKPNSVFSSPFPSRPNRPRNPGKRLSSHQNRHPLQAPAHPTNRLAEPNPTQLWAATRSRGAP